MFLLLFSLFSLTAQECLNFANFLSQKLKEVPIIRYITRHDVDGDGSKEVIIFYFQKEDRKNNTMRLGVINNGSFTSTEIVFKDLSQSIILFCLFEDLTGDGKKELIFKTISNVGVVSFDNNIPEVLLNEEAEFYKLLNFERPYLILRRPREYWIEKEETGELIFPVFPEEKIYTFSDKEPLLLKKFRLPSDKGVIIAKKIEVRGTLELEWDYSVGEIIPKGEMVGLLKKGDIVTISDATYEAQELYMQFNFWYKITSPIEGYIRSDSVSFVDGISQQKKIEKLFPNKAVRVLGQEDGYFLCLCQDSLYLVSLASKRPYLSQIELPRNFQLMKGEKHLFHFLPAKAYWGNHNLLSFYITVRSYPYSLEIRGYSYEFSYALLISPKEMKWEWLPLEERYWGENVVNYLLSFFLLKENTREVRKIEDYSCVYSPTELRYWKILPKGDSTFGWQGIVTGDKVNLRATEDMFGIKFGEGGYPQTLKGRRVLKGLKKGTVLNIRGIRPLIISGHGPWYTSDEGTVCGDYVILFEKE